MGKDTPPWGLRWRSSTFFIVATVSIGLFTDLFLYVLVVPVMPFVLRDRLSIPDNEVQSYVSALLAVYAGVQLLFSVPIGWLADQTTSRRLPFLVGLTALFTSTVLFTWGRNIAVLMVARAFQGMSAAVVWTVGLAMVLDTVGTNNLGTTMGTIFSTISIGDLLAPVVGGVLYSWAGSVGIFCVAVGIIAIDFLMRLAVIEKNTAAKYIESVASNVANSEGHGEEGLEDEREDEGGREPTERDALLDRPKDDDQFKIHDQPDGLLRSMPIFYCFRNPRLVMGLSLSLIQATFLGAFDATVPTEAHDLFGYNSLQSGLIFIALNIPYAVVGPIAGWAIDRYGTKPVTVTGFTLLIPAQVLLRLPAESPLDPPGNLILYCAILALNGSCLAMISAPGFVEASEVIQGYETANPDIFGENSSYAQLYGFSSAFFCAGLTVGPILGGVLRDIIGYGNMNAVLAAISAITSVLSFLIVGGRPRWPSLLGS
ncbi:MFS transporter-like protein [Xylariales sp. PMI_506]|nr:MFS transporter-like protein [Xylariales sp. PMI_506]